MSSLCNDKALRRNNEFCVDGLFAWIFPSAYRASWVWFGERCAETKTLTVQAGFGLESGVQTPRRLPCKLGLVWRAVCRNQDAYRASWVWFGERCAETKTLTVQAGFGLESGVQKPRRLPCKLGLVWRAVCRNQDAYRASWVWFGERCAETKTLTVQAGFGLESGVQKPRRLPCKLGLVWRAVCRNQDAYRASWVWFGERCAETKTLTVQAGFGLESGVQKPRRLIGKLWTWCKWACRVERFCCFNSHLFWISRWLASKFSCRRWKAYRVTVVHISRNRVHYKGDFSDCAHTSSTNNVLLFWMNFHPALCCVRDMHTIRIPFVPSDFLSYFISTVYLALLKAPCLYHWIFVIRVMDHE